MMKITMGIIGIWLGFWIVFPSLGFSYNCTSDLRQFASIDVLDDSWGIEVELYHHGKFSRAELAKDLKHFFEKLGMRNVQLRQEKVPQNLPYREYFISYSFEGKEYTWGLPFEIDFYDFNLGIYFLIL